MWNLKPGQYTDDTKMALCIAESLLEQKGFNADRVALKYIEWVESGDLRGIGMTCERSIYNMIRGLPLSECGKKHSERTKPSFKRIGKSEEEKGLDTDLCGNGTVMRIAPVGIFFKDDLVKLESAAKEDATMTHHHPDARDASYALSYYIASLANGSDLMDAFSELLDLKYEYPHILESLLQVVECMEQSLSLEEVAEKMGITGTANSTLGTAIYCFLSTDNFKQALINAVFMGGDTDTRAAIVGAIAGTYYGLEGIPNEWVEGVEDSDRLQSIDKKLLG